MRQSRGLIRCHARIGRMHYLYTHHLMAWLAVDCSGCWLHCYSGDTTGLGSVLFLRTVSCSGESCWLGRADFGAGVWDLFAVGPLADRQRNLINHALGPVWEANHVWLIFLIVGLFNVFPSAFSALSIALFFPFTLALLGIVLRGAAFIYRYYAIN